MELEISRDELIGALRKVTSIIANRSTLPMLSNVLFTAKDNELCLNTSDLDISILTRIPATVKKEGEATLPAKKLTQMIAMAPHEMVHFSTDENFSTTVTSGRFRFCLRGINPSEFVRLEERDDDRLILSLPKQDFRKMLQKITYAVNPEESRYLLRGICLNINDGTCTTVGTDGKRLSLVEKILDNGMELPNEEYIFPIKLVHEVEKLMDGEGEMKLYVNKSDVTVKFDTTVVNAKLIEGKYPAFRLAIPKEHEFSVEIDRVQLIDVINRVSLVISDVEENPVRFIFKENELILHAESPDLGEAEEPIEIEFDGPEEVVHHFNHDYFRDALRYLECDRITLRFSSGYKPVTILGDEGFLGVIMPRSD